MQVKVSVDILKEQSAWWCGCSVDIVMKEHHGGVGVVWILY